MRDRAIVAALAYTVSSLLLLPTIAGIAIDKLMDTTPLGLAAGAGAGVLLASMAVTRFILRRYEQLAPTDEREDTAE